MRAARLQDAPERLAAAIRDVESELAAMKAEHDSLASHIFVARGILFVGLILNALFGWWWADPIAALCMLPLIFHEGIEAVRGQACC